MQRLTRVCAVLCIASGSTLSMAQGDEANPLRLVQPFVLHARLANAEERKPVLRRDADPADVTAVTSAERDNAAEADSEPEIKSDSGVSKADLERLSKNAKESTALSDDQRSGVTTLLEKALGSLHATEEADKRRVQILAEIESVPARLDQLHAELLLPVAKAASPDVTQASLRDVDARVTEVASLLQAARERLKKHHAHDDELQASRKQAQQTLKELSEKRAEIEKHLDEQKPDGVSELHLKAWSAELRTRLERHTADERLLQAKVDLAKESTSFHPLQNDLDRREIARLEEAEQVWQIALSGKRDEEAEHQIAEAQRKAQEADPALLELAKENAAIAESRSTYASRLDVVTGDLRRIRESLAKQESSFNTIKKNVDDIGMTEAIGVLMRTHQRDLLDDRPIRVRAREIENQLPEVEQLVIDTHEQREAMWALDELAKTIVEDPEKALLTRYTPESADQMVRELLVTRRQYLSDFYSDLQNYQTKLTDLHSLLANTAAITAKHRSYINEHVLWIRSTDVVSLSDVTASKRGIAELLDVRRWQQVLHDAGTHLQRNLFVWLFLLGAFAIGLVMSDRIKDRISTLGDSKPVASDFRFLPTLEVAAETILVAAFLPVTLLLLSLYLTRFPAASSLELAIGVGLRWTAAMWLGLSLLQHVVRRGGLADAHFGWHPKNVSVIRQNLGLLAMFGLPAVFTVMVMGSFRNGDYVSSLGRLSFMVGMAVMALFTHRLLDPYRRSNGIWANREVWLYRVRHVVHACSVLMPVSLAIVAGLGYVYSAHQLAFRAQLSLWLVLAVVLVQAILGRYLRIARRTAAVRHRQHRRAEQAEHSEPEIAVEEEIDFKSIDGQVRRLLRGGTAVAVLLGILFIWADMVPALKILERVRLWQINGAVEWITLADVLLAISAVLATVMAARNVPGLLNITVFEKLPIDYGTRYALTAVSRYLISLVGIVVAFQCVGVTWHSVQWLVAAVTVGLGFGLQEIFANFVSGLIIFTERPIRVGDMVTVGGITGKVTRVQIRATTITDFDRRELVVPNKRFITEDVINWTLSDPISRVVLSVGIAYSCEPEQACQELLRVAAENPLVLDEPEPTAVFVGFGDSTLDLELRVFVVGRDNVFQIRDRLNMAINRVFKQANLEIAYPQRDLHIRSADAAVLAESLKARKAA